VSFKISLGIIIPPKTEAISAIFIPNANASSLPLNHREIIADYATDILSPPRPNITLPKIIIQ
jgi:hypothetical protein